MAGPTHTYVGPTNIYGLLQGTPCWKVGTRAGGVVIRRAGDGRCFAVGHHEVAPRTPSTTSAVRLSWWRRWRLVLRWRAWRRR